MPVKFLSRHRHGARKPSARKPTRKPAPWKAPVGGRAKIAEGKVVRKPGCLYYVDANGVIHERKLRRGGSRGHVTCYRGGKRVRCK